MMLIALTRGMYSSIDDEDHPLVSKYKWKAKKRGNNWYAESTQYGRSMHRLILDAKKGQKIDHIDGNGLNNQKSNLRFATQKQNTWNRAAHRDSTSSYRGVSWDREARKWSVDICRDGKRIKIGRFLDEREAAKAYDFMALQLFGEFARLNFP